MRRDDRSLLWLALICFVGFLISMSCISCAKSTVGKSLNVGVGAAKVLDFDSTNRAEAAGGREANPIVGTGDLRQAVVAVVGATGVIAIASLLDAKGRPVLAHVVRGMAIAVWGAAAIHNYRFAWAR